MVWFQNKLAFGYVFENFIASELLKHTANSGVILFHFRTSFGKEVDFVLENASGEIIGVEVKSLKSIDKKLQELNDACFAS